MDNINYQLDIETSEIIDAVRGQWENFQRDDLIDLSNRFARLLIKRNIDSQIYDRAINPGEFNKYLKEIIPDELKRSRSPDESPIARFFYTRKLNVITVYPDEVPIRLNFGDTDFNIFFAFKLATIGFESIEAFFNHQLATSFDQDKRKFTNYLLFILSDQKSIFNGRLSALTDLAEEFLGGSQWDVTGPVVDSQADGKRFISDAVNDHLFEKIFFSSAIPYFKECEIQLLEREFLNADHKWQKTLEECAALVMVLYEKSFIKKPIKKDQLNSLFGKSLKPFFEERYGLKFTKQMQPAYRSSTRVGVYKLSFEFIPALK